MKLKLILTLGVIALTVGFIGCGGAANTSVNVNAKPANAANTSSATPASSPASSNSNADKSSTASNEDLDFTLINKTGYDIKSVSVGPTGEKDWTPEDEVLKGRNFPNGASLDIKFHPKEKAAKWDLKIEWADGDPSVEWLAFNLTKIGKLTLKYDKASGKTTAEMEP